MVEPRIAIDRAAILEDSSGHQYDCRILDVSSQGFRLKVLESINGPAIQILRIDKEVYYVEIRWVTLEEAGGIFLD